MRTLAYYRRQAEECRAIARQVTLREAKERLLEMAEEWDGLARSREAELRRKGICPPPEGSSAPITDL